MYPIGRVILSESAMRTIWVVAISLALFLTACEEISQSASKAFDNANSAIKDKVFIPDPTPTANAAR